eukprot:m.139607 g.139607  ORF g.139607 m.139607 type:complete len:282 (-) comp14020_c0_seq1:210-1055(-)
MAATKLQALLDGTQGRNSSEVLSVAQQAMPSILGLSDPWSAFEKIIMATFDSDVEEHREMQEECFEQLEARFPNSLRVRRLQGMAFEARGDWDAAMETYNSLLEQDSGDAVALKRKVCVYEAQGDLTTALTTLNIYLKDTPLDVDAWQHAADLNIELQHYESAVYCLEELILHSPFNHVYYTKAAEVLYTINSAQSLTTARKYFAKALSLNPGNVRALYGLAMAAHKTQPKSKRKGGDEDAVSVADLLETACDELQKAYEKAPAECQDAVLSMTDALEDKE